MKTDGTEERLLRLAEDLADGRAVDWVELSPTDPVLIAGIEGLRDIEALAAALNREPEPLDSRAQARAWLEPGTMLGRYPVEREAGRGGMGVVYLARDQVLDRPVALKLLPPDVARSPERLARFTREAKLLASLNHPNVATIYGLEESAGLRFLVLEWVAGESLAARLQRGPLPWREGLDVCGQIARGLVAAHEGGVIHRDLKPGNVMITPQSRVKVLDFGLARRGLAPGDLPAGPSDPGINGTWGYVSPECLTRSEDQRADVFAFGCVLYECLAGAPAFPGESVDEIRAALLHREPEEARLPVETPPAIRRLISSCVVKDPDRRLGSMAEALRTIEAALGSRPFPAVARSGAAVAVPHHLPEETDAFVGRETDLGELAQKLRRGARLVTLQGGAGMGKTRLAIRYGWQSLEEWSGGVWFCDLTEAKSRDGIAAAVAGALGVPLGNADPVEQLGRAIAGRGRCVLILDNFEQVVTEAESGVAPWLAHAAEARFVVTSRERLELPEEQVQTIEPLESEPGAELFVERARRHRPGFEPEGPEAELVREVVRQVDGIPLAIELAAARMRAMSPAQIVARMQERFRLLAGTGGGRHGTLRAAIDGSWELLDPWEQAAFAQCAVFDGGFALAAAEEVLDLKEWKEAPWIPDVIQSLVDQSLLRTWVPEREGVAAGAEVRFGMFVSLQEYAREKLEQEGAIPDGGSGTLAAGAAEERHGRCYARHGSEEQIAALHRRGGPERMRALGRELDNLVVACRRAAARGDGETVVATCEAAWEVFDLRGPSGAGVDLGRAALAALPEEKDRRRALMMLGQAEWRSGRVTEARVHLEAALALHREEGDRRWEGNALRILGALHAQQGRLEESLAQCEAALTIARESGDRRFEGMVLRNLGIVDREQGRLEEARTHYEEALIIFREVGDRVFEGRLLSNLGVLDTDRGQLDEGRTHLEAALAADREVGNRAHEGIVLCHLGFLDRDQGHLDEGRTHLEAAIIISREVGDRYYQGVALGGLGLIERDEGRMDEARAQFEAALTINREIGNRRFEGVMLDQLGRLHFGQGRFDEARAMFAQGDLVFRAIDHRLDLGRLLCVRAELEHRSGDLVAAQAALREAEAIAVELKTGADLDLRGELAKAREAIAPQS